MRVVKLYNNQSFSYFQQNIHNKIIYYKRIYKSYHIIYYIKKLFPTKWTPSAPSKFSKKSLVKSPYDPMFYYSIKQDHRHPTASSISHDNQAETMTIVS